MSFYFFKILFVCVCSLPFSWETILVNSLPLGWMQPKCRNVLWLTENVKGKPKPCHIGCNLMLKLILFTVQQLLSLLAEAVPLGNLSCNWDNLLVWVQRLSLFVLTVSDAILNRV